MIYMYTHNGILLSHKKNEIMPFVATWIDLENIMFSEISQMTKANIFCITYMWNLKITQMDIYAKQTHRYRRKKKFTVNKRKRDGEGTN